VLVTSGGVSMGEADLLKPALSAVGTVWHSFCMQHQVIWCVCSTKSFVYIVYTARVIGE
jgi:hypothetical protein